MIFKGMFIVMIGVIVIMMVDCYFGISKNLDGEMILMRMKKIMMMMMC